jgi:acetoin utilization deacetylase AcuC-like enzyme
MIATRLYTNHSGLRHDTGPNIPERVRRMEVIHDLFKEKPFSGLELIEAQPADMKLILRAHTQKYFDFAMETVPDRGYAFLDEETVLSPGSWDAALDAAGAACMAVDDVCGGTVKRAFCAVRPPGHHALPERAMGFCIFNNVFIAARHAQEEHGVKRVAIVDFDVHHGNATDYTARTATDIFFVSSHQFPFWPGTGDPQYDEPGKTLNIPLPAGSGSEYFRKEYEDKVFPALNKFRPELLLISAGFDAHRDDPLANINLVEDDYVWVTEKLGGIADAHCGGRIVSMLEGGYNVDALKSCVGMHIKALAGI